MCWQYSASESQIVPIGIISQFVPPSPTNAENGCIPARSAQPNGQRLAYVYLPDGYDQNDTQMRYPVIYWLSGFNGTGENAAIANGILLDYLIAEKLMVPSIVVTPDPTLPITFRFTDPECTFCPPGDTCHLAGFDPDYASYGNSFYINSDLNNVSYEDFFIQELVPYIDNTFNTIANPNFRGISGHSMGGYGALLLGMRYPEVFSCIGAESPTPPFMFTNVETWPNPPSYDAFTLNSIFIGGITKNNGLVTPCNEGLRSEVGFSDFVFAMAAALSPNTTGGTSFTDAFQVNLPIYVNPDGTASLVDGTFSVVDFAKAPNEPVFYSVVDQSVVLNQSVIDIWHQNDPYYQLENHVETLKKQAIYIDGGDDEPINNVGSRLTSDKMMQSHIDNEYILYKGQHTTDLFDFTSSRNLTIFKMFSAKFAAAGACINDISSKLMGTLHLILEDNAAIDVNYGSVLSIQTSATVPDPMNPISNTNVSITLKDQSAIHMGTANEQGGALQIGDPFTKALLQEYNTGPATALADHEVRCTILLDGKDTLFEIGKEGFFGVGIGVIGKSNINLPLSPTVANFWGVTSLANLKDIRLILNQGTLKHQVISSGDQEPASLMALDLSNAYLCSINPQCARILGGANLLCTKHDPFAPDFINRQVRLLHPTVLNIGNTLPNPELIDDMTDCPDDPAGGIINKANFDPNATDSFLDNPIGSSTAYTNYIQRGILQSTPLFDRGDVTDAFSITTTTLDELCDFLRTKEYKNQPIKLANLSNSPENPTIAYVQEVSFIDTFFFNLTVPLIERKNESELPIDPQQNIDFDALQSNGALGIELELAENIDQPDKLLFNIKELIRIYDPHTDLSQ